MPLALPSLAQAAGGGISGVVRNSETKKHVKDALVIIQCTCLAEPRELTTNANGLYAFRNLPAGSYTVQVFAGQSNVTKYIELDRNEQLRAGFTVDPDKAEVRDVVVHRPVRGDTTSATSISGRDLGKLPVGNDVSRDALSAVVQMAPTGGKDAAGPTIAGSSGAEVSYELNGMSLNGPSTGTVAMPLLTDFVERIEVQEANFSAERGGFSGGRVSARRISGSNKLRGSARFTFTPRIGQPRLIVATDNAIRATETPDYQMEGAVSMRGPIVKDRLFWFVGFGATGSRSTLLQSFHHRVDKDGSGGYEACPYENGALDCAEGGDYIATRKFGDKAFPTRRVRGQGALGIDWAINPKHRIGLTATGTPTFLRRSYRRPAGGNLDPDVFGANPNADPLGGASTVANGVVDGAFGWDRAVSGQAGLEYNGRVFRDTVEIDANLGHLQSAFDEAWRLDDPSLRNKPATEQRDAQGESLFKLLDRENRLDLVDGVTQACNDADLPGLTCPVRSWRSGGIGQYALDRSSSTVGRVALTHFFEAAGAHQLKWGGQFAHNQRRRRLQFSGENSADFTNNCAEAGLEGGGEWCYDQGADAYAFRVNRANRVDNHRIIYADTDNPNRRITQGFGRVRHEQDDLRAIATGLGQGVRVDAYDETVSSQNYAAFLHDRWAITTNLFVDAGLRWEAQDMRDVRGRRAFFIKDNVSPRAGMVYDWTEEGRSRLYTGYGMFFQQMPLALLNRVYGGMVEVVRNYDNSICDGNSVATINGDQPMTRDQQPTEWCRDTAMFTSGLQAGATVPQVRGQFDHVWQIGYEQEVIEDLTLGVRWLHRSLGRAVEDVSTDGGNNYLIANPGEAVSPEDIARQEQSCRELDAQVAALTADDPREGDLLRDLQRCEFLADAYARVGELYDRPVRNYDAFSFTLNKRIANNWLLNGSYTYSRQVGNYDGFVDPVSGAINVGGSLQFNTPELVRNSFGPLSYDSPHRVNLDGYYTADLGDAGQLVLGGSLRVRSGYPISMRGGSNRFAGSFPIYVLPRGSGGRVKPNYQLNANVQYAYPLPGRMVLTAGARLINVTNAKAVLRVDEIYTFDNARPIAGGDMRDLKHAKAVSARNPNEFFTGAILRKQGNFGTETAFQIPMFAQFDIGLQF
ncbi:MAG: TonB-dependent receptor [Myxococcota bacterium]